MNTVKQATIADIALLLPALLELRTNRTADELMNLLEIQFKTGEYQVYYIGDEKIAYAVVGVRTLNLLHSGKTLYIDDLVTYSAHRKLGYGGQLIAFIKQLVKDNNYDHLSLDSGFQRKEAYRLYLNTGFEVASLHFGRNVNEL